mgnify:CR=1 FL=1
MFIRLCDFKFALVGLILGFPLLFILMAIGLWDTGAPIFRQERVGRNKKSFVLFKFRTMEKNTISVASHLVSSSAVTKFGGFLRKTYSLPPDTN